MTDHIETVKGFFGEKKHYRNGELIGESWPGLFGGSYDHYDADGHYAGHSDPGLFTDMNHYDADGKPVGYTQRGVFGNWNHYDEDGYTGTTVDTLFGETTELDMGE